MTDFAEGSARTAAASMGGPAGRAESVASPIHSQQPRPSAGVDSCPARRGPSTSRGAGAHASERRGFRPGHPETTHGCATCSQSLSSRSPGRGTGVMCSTWQVEPSAYTRHPECSHEGQPDTVTSTRLEMLRGLEKGWEQYSVESRRDRRGKARGVRDQEFGWRPNPHTPPPSALVNKVLSNTSTPFFMHHLWLLLCREHRGCNYNRGWVSCKASNIYSLAL